MKPIKFKCPSCAKPIIISETEDGFEITQGKQKKENENEHDEQPKSNSLEEFLRGLE